MSAQRTSAGIITGILLVAAAMLILWPSIHDKPSRLAAALARGGMGQRALPPHARALGALAPDARLRLVLGLAPRDRPRLEAFLQRQRAMGITLTPAQFGAEFGPDPAREGALLTYLRAHHLRVTRTYPDHLLLDLEGRAADVAAAFDTPLVRYRDGQGRMHFANSRTPRLPATLSTMVSAVIGLRDDGAPPRPALSLYTPAEAAGSVPAPRAARPPIRHLDRPSPTRRSADAGGPPTYMLAPAQVRAAYNVEALRARLPASAATAGEALAGAGQTIALLQLGPFDQTDIASFDRFFGIAATTPISVTVDGGATNSFGFIGRVEATLDVEMIHAIAPGARLLVYNGPGASTGTDNSGMDDTYARIINDNQAQVLSTSWGQCEPEQMADAPPDMTLLHDLFEQASAQGMTVLAASGDSGSGDCAAASSNPSVDYPASDPAVLGVGGTTLSLDSTGLRQNETGWSGSGGGTSVVYPRPTWQAGGSLPSSSFRQVPDIALNAGTAYAAWVSNGWLGVGGTSGATPIWAGLLALANQARYANAAGGAPPACATLAGFGDLHAALYRLAASPPPTPIFRDITDGDSNGAGAPGLGWDPVTGWGVPDAPALALALRSQPDLVAPTPAPCSPTPHATATAAAMVSGTSTATPTPSMTATATATITASATASATVMPSSTRTAVPSATVTKTATVSPTVTPSNTPTASFTVTATVTTSPTRSATPTATMTASPSFTPTATFSPTRTATPTVTVTTIATSTATTTVTPTASTTATATMTATRTVTATALIVIASATPLPSRTATSTPSPVPTSRPAVRVAAVALPSSTPTLRPSATPTRHPTATATATRTATHASGSPATVHKTSTPTPTATPTPGKRATATCTHPTATGACKKPAAGKTTAKKPSSKTSHVKTPAKHPAVKHASTTTKQPAVKHAKPKTKPVVKRHVVIPSLLVHVASLHRGQRIVSVQLDLHWVSGVQLHLTLIARHQPRHHATLRTDKHGAVRYQFQFARPAPGQTLTTQIRVWGVYARHRKTTILSVKVTG